MVKKSSAHDTGYKLIFHSNYPRIFNHNVWTQLFQNNYSCEEEDFSGQTIFLIYFVGSQTDKKAQFECDHYADQFFIHSGCPSRAKYQHSIEYPYQIVMEQTKHTSCSKFPLHLTAQLGCQTVQVLKPNQGRALLPHILTLQSQSIDMATIIILYCIRKTFPTVCL